VAATNAGARTSYAGLDAVGLAEVRIDGVPRTEIVRPPTDRSTPSARLGRPSPHLRPHP
jgi:hypothetical protein